MKKTIVTNSVGARCRRGALLLLALAFSSRVDAKNTLELIRKIPHSGYSEGLDFARGYLWNALPKAIHQIDPADGTVLKKLTPSTDYSESLKWIGDELWNLSFSNNGIYRGKLGAKDLEFKKVGETPEKVGWGLEQVGEEIVVTGNFSSKLYFLNRGTMKKVREITTPITDLEDLAVDGKRVWASSFTQHKGHIFSIDLKTGAVGPLYSLPNPEECPVIDGIAKEGQALWITGKECPSIYKVKIPK